MPILRCGRFPFLSKVCSEARLGSKATVAWMRSICHRVACRWPVPLDQMRQRHREAPNLEKQSQIRTAVAKHGTHPNSKNDFSHASDAGGAMHWPKSGPTRCSRGRQIDCHAIPRPKARDTTCTSCSFSIELEQKTLAAYNPTFLQQTHKTEVSWASPKGRLLLKL
jgi:hypothetical protein